MRLRGSDWPSKWIPVCQPESNTAARGDRHRARAAAHDPLRQQAGADQSAFSRVVCERKIETLHIQPGEPTQNHGRKFPRTIAGSVLNVSWFRSMFDAKRKIARSKIEYNESVRIAASDTKLRKSCPLPRSRPLQRWARGRGLKRRPCPFASPSRLKPKGS